ncbi:MAG: hypothetical protein KAV80_00850 [Methanomicrobia archaeon]|nr:hypothetical protein [Methanomicrobia archaeon]
MRSELELKKRYNRSKHHAWAGLGFLSVFLAITRFFSVSNLVSIPVTLILSSYIVISLIFTYRYREGLLLQEDVTLAEKEKLKLEKKRLKSELKVKKKENKN